MGEIFNATLRDKPNMYLSTINEESKYFVGTCTHILDKKYDDYCAVRIEYLNRHQAITKVAISEEGVPLGFIEAFASESGLGGFWGENLLSILCLCKNHHVCADRGSGVGRNRTIRLCQ